MLKNQSMEYAGSLEQEMQEIENIIPVENNVEIPASTTVTCDRFLTLICC